MMPTDGEVSLWASLLYRLSRTSFYAFYLSGQPAIFQCFLASVKGGGFLISPVPLRIVDEASYSSPKVSRAPEAPSNEEKNVVAGLWAEYARKEAAIKGAALPVTEEERLLELAKTEVDRKIREYLSAYDEAGERPT
jgi:hypothetical protein